MIDLRTRPLARESGTEVRRAAEGAADEPTSVASRRTAVRLVVLVLALGAGFSAWLGSGGPVGDARPLALSISHVVTPALAALLCWIPARHSVSRGDRTAWLLLGICAATWSAASVVFASHLLGGDNPPYPSVADLLYLGYAVPALAGLFAFSWSVPHAVSRWHTLLDGLTIASGVVVISWHYLLGDLFRIPEMTAPERAVTWAYPIGDLTVAAVVLGLAWRPTRARFSLGLVGVGLLLVAVCDTFYVKAGVTETLVVGGAFWQAGYTLGFLLVGVAAVTFDPAAGTAEPATGNASGRGRIRWADLASQSSVYVVLAGAVAATLLAPDHWTDYLVLRWLMFVTIGLAVVREVLVVADTVALRSGLERLVTVRTAELEASRARLRAVTRTASDAIVVIDSDGRVRAWNTGAEALFGCPEEEALGAELTRFMPARYRDAHLAGLARRRGAEAPLAKMIVELTARHVTGAEIPVELSLTGFTHDGEQLFTGILRDVSERRRAEERQAREHAHVELIQQVALTANGSSDVAQAVRATLRLVSDEMGWPVAHAFLADGEEPDARIRTVAWRSVDEELYRPLIEKSESTRFTRRTGVPGLAFATGQPAWSRTHEPAVQLPRGMVAQQLGLRAMIASPIRSRDQLVGVLEFFATDDRPLEPDVLQLLSTVGTQIGRVFERDQAEQRLSKLAHEDPLTGLANRVVFNERLERHVALAAQQGRTAVLLLDLDDFKEVNDTLGHAAGDELLVEVGRRLRASSRASDVVARLGGDEFAVIVTHVSEDSELEARVARMRQALSEPMPLGDRQVRLRGSIGVALTSGADSADVLLRNADIAMYDAKAAGKGEVSFFAPQMHAEMVDRLELESALDRAVDAGELRVLYRPIAALSTGRVVGREALLRWQHPERGLLDPARVLRATAASGVAGRVTRWLMDRAAADTAAWREQGEDEVALWLELSVRDVRPDLVEHLASTLRRHRVPPAGVSLQLAAPGGSRLDEDAADALARAGFRFVLSDFSTAKAEQRRLRDLPVHTLRIGSHLVDGLPDDPTSRAMVDALVSLGRSMEVDVAASGVDDLGPLRFLDARGCWAVQGAVVGAATPFDERARGRVLAVASA